MSYKKIILAFFILLPSLANATYLALPFYNVKMNPGSSTYSFYNVVGNKSVTCSAANGDGRSWFVSWDVDPSEAVYVTLVKNVVINEENAEPQGILMINGIRAKGSIEITCEYNK